MASLPVSNIPIAHQSLLERQLGTLKELGLTDTTLVSGYGRAQLPDVPINEIYNGDFETTKVADSLMLAHEKLSEGFIMVFGDIIFNKKLLSNHLLNIDSDILLLIDNSFNLNTRQSIKPTTDLVVISGNDIGRLRKPHMVTESIADIGNNIPLDKATHEFIGIAKFSKQGAQWLQGMYDKLSKSADQAVPIDFNWIIKSLIKEGVAVEAMEVNSGWSEVHTMSDVAAIEKDINRSAKKMTSPV